MRRHFRNASTKLNFPFPDLYALLQGFVIPRLQTQTEIYD